MNPKDFWLVHPTQQLSREVDRLFEELIHRRWGAGHPGEEWPQLDLYETESAFILEADLPGVKKQDVSVAIENDTLVLQGARSRRSVTTRGRVHCCERRSGYFVRRLSLPASIDQKRIRAAFRQGVLRVTLAKAPERQAESSPAL